MPRRKYHDHDDSPRRPRDPKRTHRAKRNTINRRAERRAKFARQGR